MVANHSRFSNANTPYVSSFGDKAGLAMPPSKNVCVQNSFSYMSTNYYHPVAYQ